MSGSVIDESEHDFGQAGLGGQVPAQLPRIDVLDGRRSPDRRPSPGTLPHSKILERLPPTGKCQWKRPSTVWNMPVTKFSPPSANRKMPVENSHRLPPNRKMASDKIVTAFLPHGKCQWKIVNAFRRPENAGDKIVTAFRRMVSGHANFRKRIYFPLGSR
jgi:hypothetical protein